MGVEEGRRVYRLKLDVGGLDGGERGLVLFRERLERLPRGSRERESPKTSEPPLLPVSLSPASTRHSHAPSRVSSLGSGPALATSARTRHVSNPIDSSAPAAANPRLKNIFSFTARRRPRHRQIPSRPFLLSNSCSAHSSAIDSAFPPTRRHMRPRCLPRAFRLGEGNVRMRRS